MGASYLSEDEDYTIEMMAEDVLVLLRHLKLTRVALLGFSMGGLVAQALATREDAQPTADQAGVRVGGIEVRALVLAATFAKLPRGDFHPSKMYV